MGEDEVAMGIDSSPRDSIDLILGDTTRYIREARERRNEEAHLVVRQAIHELTVKAGRSRAESIANFITVLSLVGLLISLVVTGLGFVLAPVSP